MRALNLCFSFSLRFQLLCSKVFRAAIRLLKVKTFNEFHRIYVHNVVECTYEHTPLSSHYETHAAS